MIRVMLVDDEAPARDRLRRLLGKYEDVEIVGEAADGVEALERVPLLRPDLVFLDIEMPGCNGLDVARQLAVPRPRVVFCTAYDNYAVEAFELHTVDYLLKPAHRGRLEKALKRTREQLQSEREVASAGATQAGLMRRDGLNFPALDTAGLCRPARGVGGDYFDFLPLEPQRLGIAVGDVSGKGMFAGLLMAALQARLQGLVARLDPQLDRILDELNRVMFASLEASRYVTLFYGVFDAKDSTLNYVNAGHAPPFWIRPGDPNGSTAEEREGFVRRLQANGRVIGLLEDSAYEQRSVELQAGDVLALFTDGVDEALDPSGNEFGVERLERALLDSVTLSAESIRDHIIEQVDSFCAGTEAHDDTTIVILKVPQVEGGSQ